MRSTHVFFFLAFFLCTETVATAVPVRVSVELAQGQKDVGSRTGTLRLVPLGPDEPDAPRPVELAIRAPEEREIDLPVGGTWQAEVVFEGFWAAPQMVVPGQAGAGVRLRLLPLGRLRGAVVLPRGEKPFESFDVRFQTSPAGPSATSVEGSLSCPVREGVFECSVPAGIFDLRLRSEGWVPVYLWSLKVDPGKTRDLGPLPWRRGASVSGWVRLESGEALPAGCRVELSPAAVDGPMDQATRSGIQRLTLEAQVNGRGFYQVSGVPPGSYELQASLQGFAPARIAPLEVRKDLEAQVLEPLLLGRPATLTVILDPPIEPYGKPWKIMLTRRATETGPPLESFEGEASQDGTWSRKGLAPGLYEVMVLGELKSRWHVELVEVKAGLPPLHVELPVLRVRGLVTQGKKPLATTLWLINEDRRSLRFDSDAEGRFSGALPAEGTWNVEVRSEDKMVRLPLEPVDVKAGPDGRPVEIEIVVPNTRLVGEVVDEEGQPVPAAALRFHSPKKREHGRFKADEKGRFSIRGLPPGSVTVRADLGDLTGDWVQATLEEDVESPWLRLVVRRQRKIEGRVVSVHGGVAGALVVAFPPFKGGFVSSASEAVTGPQGGFSLRIPPDAVTLDVFVYPPGSAFRMVSVVVGAEQSTLDIPVEPEGGTLVIDFGADPASMPSPQIVHAGASSPVEAVLEWAQVQGLRREEGSFRRAIPNVEAGLYSLCVGAAASAKLREGQEPPAAACASGVLAPNGELVLKVPSSPAAP